MTRIERAHEVLKQGPAISRVLADRMGVEQASFGSWLQYQLAKGKLVIVGTFAQALLAKREDIVDPAYKLGKFTRGDAAVYALPGTPLLPPISDDDERPVRRARSSSGSGQIAGPIRIGRRMMQHWGH